VDKIPTTRRRRTYGTPVRVRVLNGFGAVVLITSGVLTASPAMAVEPHFLVADIGHGIRLHYLAAGSGSPVIFVHGSLSDAEYWEPQIAPFATHYRVIAYSRRYNYPNANLEHPGYSAVVDAEDLAGLILTLHLGKVVVVGHSYGALTALFLAARHPELVRAMVLAEPPAVSLLTQLPGDQATEGRAMFDDIQRRMITPMQQAFRRRDREVGVAAFVDYVFNDPHAWEKMPETSRTETLRDGHEWDVMMTTGTLFPAIDPRTIRAITTPVLLLSGAKSYPFLGVIMRELARLLPNNQSIVLPDAGHQMWYQHPEVCRKDVESFLGRLGVR